MIDEFNHGLKKFASGVERVTQGIFSHHKLSIVLFWDWFQLNEPEDSFDDDSFDLPQRAKKVSEFLDDI